MDTMKRNYCHKVCVQSFNERRPVKPVTSLSNIILTSRNFFKEADDWFIWCNLFLIILLYEKSCLTCHVLSSTLVRSKQLESTLRFTHIDES